MRNGFDPSAKGSVDGRVLVLDAQAPAVCRVLAMADPKRDSPQDLFDLSVLLKTELEDPTRTLVSQHRGALKTCSKNFGYKATKKPLQPRSDSLEVMKTKLVATFETAKPRSFWNRVLHDAGNLGKDWTLDTGKRCGKPLFRRYSCSQCKHLGCFNLVHLHAALDKRKLNALFFRLFRQQVGEPLVFQELNLRLRRDFHTKPSTYSNTLRISTQVVLVQCRQVRRWSSPLRFSSGECVRALPPARRSGQRSTSSNTATASVA